MLTGQRSKACQLKRHTQSKTQNQSASHLIFQHFLHKSSEGDQGDGSVAVVSIFEETLPGWERKHFYDHSRWNPSDFILFILYLSLLTVAGSGSSDRLKRSHPSGHVTPSGRTEAARTGGGTRCGGAGHFIASALSSFLPVCGLSSSVNLAHLVLMSQAGSSAGETCCKNEDT